MQPIDRRTFLSGLAGSFVGASALALRAPVLSASQYPEKSAPARTAADRSCWLDVAAPFVVEDAGLGIGTELLLTATCFPGIDGYSDARFGTEYEVLLYDAQGREVNTAGAGRMLISSMRPTVVRTSELLGHTGRATNAPGFWGSARVRLAPRGPNTTHAGDLFSAGFVRWNTPQNFDNVHAHPAAPAQARGRFYYSMPFPSLEEYHCAFALFNPSEDLSEGWLRLVNPLGQTVVERRYKLRPRQTTLYSLGDLKPAASPGEALAISAAPSNGARQGGVVAVVNQTEAVAFAYTLMKGRDGGAFSVEHPLHFQDNPVKPARKSPFTEKGAFPAEALLYTPMLFSGRRFGGVELESRMYLSASRWLEDALWLMPFVTDERGMIAWVSNRDERFPERVAPAALAQQGVLRLGFFQSCRVDARALPLPDGFSGGFGVAAIPKTSHSLLKIEVRARNWGRAAFTHFRPGGAAHQRYRGVVERGGLATDYIVSGCQVRGRGDRREHDSLLAIMNIEFQDEKPGAPRLQLFGPKGLLAETLPGEFPALACRHYLLSELFPNLQTEPGQPLTLRMMDPEAMMVVSALHLDYGRRDLALEHGSDRHSTWLDYGC